MIIKSLPILINFFYVVCNEENATKHQGKEKKHHANKSQEDGNSREELEDFLDDLLDD